ncbi:hypothetical protein B0T14DRAFT_569112 [Immersiella caudata]|uniref:C2H2-type domain-containing protein n=1 Tax=Immersiella caudata TaxID=314043 RepID=A0AA39WLL3_9PEZI|nr:hypothetical protein B0T14DRAFT_569112 [Immersiella caudata]
MASENSSQQVFDKARREFERELPSRISFQSLLRVTTIDEVYDAAREYQDEQVKTSGGIRNLQRIQPLLDHLKEYAAVIEVFVQVQPDILALIWGPIKLLLQLVSGWNQGYDAVVKTMERIGELLPCFSDVVTHFLDIERIKDILALFFRDILDFFLAMFQFFSLPRRKIVFETLWSKHRERIKIVEANIERHSRLLGDNITYEHIRREHEARDKTFENFGKAEASWTSQRFRALEAAICPPTYGTRLDGLRNKICDGTARWIEKNHMFCSWIDMSSPSTKPLWLCGIPGAGKTVLACWVTDIAKKAGRTIYAFPSHQDRDVVGTGAPKLHADTAAISIMHSLLFQLAYLDAKIQTMLTDSDPSDLKTDTKFVKELLADALKCAGDTFMVIDGLDEVEELQRNQFLTSMMEILDASGDPKLRVCISSRAEDDIAKMLQPRADTVRVDKENGSAIFTYVSNRYEQWMANSDFLDDGRSEIKVLLQPVSTRAKGMFLYARIVIDNVVNMISIEEIRRELRVLPEDLDDAYERALTRIQRLPARARDSAKSVLGWIGCSPIPMSKYELEQAMLVGAMALTDAPVVDSPLNFVKLCGPIVEVVDDRPQYVHFTVKEYLLNREPSFVSMRDSTMELLVVCLTYLCYDAVSDDEIEEGQIMENLLAGRYRLHVFASTVWFDLVKQWLRLTPHRGYLAALSGLMHNLNAELANPEAVQNTGNTGGQAGASTHSTPVTVVGVPLWPGAPEFISRAFLFSKHQNQDTWTLNNADNWANLDPLTVSRSCARIETAYHDLLRHGSDSEHQQDCVCPKLRRHYGSRLHKCHYFACGFRRYGFGDAADCAKHMANHCRPWKCPDRSCDFAVIGFQSRPDLEHHRRRIHRVARAANSIEPSNLEDEALYPMLYELVETADIGELEANWPSCRGKVNDRTAADLIQMAAEKGSLPIVQLLLEWDDERQEPSNDKVKLDLVVSDAAQSGNLELAAWALDKATAWSQADPETRRYRSIVVAVLKSDSAEVFQAWHEVITSDKHSQGNVSLIASELFEKTVLNTAKRFPNQQMRLFATWRQLVGLDPGSAWTDALGRALTWVAQSTCCIEQARVLLDLGAPIDFPQSGKRQGYTALHWASKKTSQEAAEFMRFLILEGAETDVLHGNIAPADGEGARNIHTWLDTTWTQLVEMGKVRKGKEDESGHHKT